MIKLRIIAGAVAAGTLLALGMPFTSGAQAALSPTDAVSPMTHGSCVPGEPRLVNGVEAVVVFTNHCSNVTTGTGRLQRYRGFLIGWRTVASATVSPNSTRIVRWNCDGVGTYTYRGTFSLSTYLAIGPEKRFSC